MQVYVTDEPPIADNLVIKVWKIYSVINWYYYVPELCSCKRKCKYKAYLA